MKASRAVKWSTQQLNSILTSLRDTIESLSALKNHRYKTILQMLIVTNLISVLLFGLRLIGAENFRYWFMLWNLTLAWIAPLLAWWLVMRLRNQPWSNWFNIVLSVAWIGFLPNSFYMVSDLIHVQQTGEVNIIFDTVMFSSFIFNGFIAGYLGTYLIHGELLKRFSVRAAYGLVIGIFAICSFAIYLGRILRWNTWDALLQPTGLIFDISDTFIRPLEHPQAFVITFSFTILITSFYLLLLEVFKALRSVTR